MILYIAPVEMVSVHSDHSNNFFDRASSEREVIISIFYYRIYGNKIINTPKQQNSLLFAEKKEINVVKMFMK